MSLLTRTLGKTGIEVSILGLGAGPLGDLAIDDAKAHRLVRHALDLGITLIDTAPSYGASEERIGRAVRDVRERVVLVTKGGYGVPGEADWTPRCIALGIERALVRLDTDRIDVFLLHSCDLSRLARGDLLEPMIQAKTRGLVRAIGYSGDCDALAWAVSCGAFDVVECSVNVVDHAALRESVPHAAARGIGVLAKRSLAGAVWKHATRPVRPDLATYWDRVRASPLPSTDPLDFAARFAAFAPGVTCALVGATDVDQLTQAAASIARGPVLSPDRDRGEWFGIV